MEGTHVRFARDLAERLGVTDFAAYYSGAVYPDSRYATGIPREETHDGAHCPNDPFAAGLTDFEKGWATHLLYDRASMGRRAETLGLIPEAERADGWAFATAVKLIEDLESVRVLGPDIAVLRTIAIAECPRGEQRAPMERYYADLREAYATPCGSSSDYRAFSLKLGIAPDRADRMVALADRYANDAGIRAALLAVYPYVLSSL